MLFAQLLFLSILSAAATQNTPNPVPTAMFFLSLTPKCQFNNASLDPGSTFQTAGSLCAYVEEADLVYSCPAEAGVCWNDGGQCTGGNATQAGLDEVACSNIGVGNVNWCCNSQYGNCTQTEYQENNCWSWFLNPNRGINSLAASSSASVAMQAAQTMPSVTNIIVSTSPLGGWVIDMPTAPSSIGITPSSTMSSGTMSFSSTSSTANLIPLSSTTSSTKPSMEAPAISITNGAVAGIAVGAALFSLISAATGILFWNRSKRLGIKRGEQEVSTTLPHIMTVPPEHPAPSFKPEYYEHPAELPDTNVAKELPPYAYT